MTHGHMPWQPPPAPQPPQPPQPPSPAPLLPAAWAAGSPAHRAPAPADGPDPAPNASLARRSDRFEPSSATGFKAWGKRGVALAAVHPSATSVNLWVCKNPSCCNQEVEVQRSNRIARKKPERSRESGRIHSKRRENFAPLPLKSNTPKKNCSRSQSPEADGMVAREGADRLGLFSNTKKSKRIGGWSRSTQRGSH